MNKNNKEETLIPNGQIEVMFLRICTDTQMEIFVSHVDAGRINLATAYASNIVYKKFFQMIEGASASGSGTIKLSGGNGGT